MIAIEYELAVGGVIDVPYHHGRILIHVWLTAPVTFHVLRRDDLGVPNPNFDLGASSIFVEEGPVLITPNSAACPYDMIWPVRCDFPVQGETNSSLFGY